MNLFEFIKYRY